MIAAILLAGCAPVISPISPNVPRDTDTVWDAMAKRVQENKIETTDEGLKILREMVRSGDLSLDEAKKIDALGWEKSRKLEPSDADKLRGLK